VDCAGEDYGNFGCDGGWPSSSLTFVENNGITTETAYPYTGRDG
jgi:hypothetical protein